jgi:hypothetical protein
MTPDECELSDPAQGRNRLSWAYSGLIARLWLTRDKSLGFLPGISQQMDDGA